MNKKLINLALSLCLSHAVYAMEQNQQEEQILEIITPGVRALEKELVQEQKQQPMYGDPDVEYKDQRIVVNKSLYTQWLLKTSGIRIGTLSTDGIMFNLALRDKNFNVAQSLIGRVTDVRDLDTLQNLIGRMTHVSAQESTGTMPPSLAIQNGGSAVTDLISQGVNLHHGNKPVVEGDTELHMAVRNRDRAKIEALLRSGVEPDARNSHGDTPLLLATRNKDKYALYYLLHYKVDTNAKNKHGTTPLHCTIENDDAVTARCLIEHGADINVRDKDGNTLLHLAAKIGAMACTRFFLEHIDPNNVNNHMQTPLHYALESKSIEMQRDLIAHGARIDTVTTDGSMLHLAIRNRDSRTIRAIIDKIPDINAQDSAGKTPLHLAIQNGDDIIVTDLINHGANPNIRDEAGNTPLHLAVRTGNPGIVKSILAHSKADINAQDRDGNTPLHVAIGNEGMVEILLANGADANIPNNRGNSPLHLTDRSPASTIRLLKKHGANIHAKNNDGQTPYQAVVETCTSKNNGEIMPGVVEELETSPSSLLDHVRVVVLGDQKQPNNRAVSATVSRYSKSSLVCVLQEHENVRAALGHRSNRQLLQDSEPPATSSSAQENSPSSEVESSPEGTEEAPGTSTPAQQQPYKKSDCLAIFAKSFWPATKRVASLAGRVANSFHDFAEKRVKEILSNSF